MTKKVTKQQKIPPGDTRELVTIEETADYLRIGINRVHTYIKMNILETRDEVIETRKGTRKQKMVVRQSVIELLQTNTINRSEQ